MGQFIFKSLTSMGGDMYGNLFVMKQGMKVANSLTGGKLTLIQKDRVWKEMAKNTALKASVFAAMTFSKTDGTLAERTKAATLTLAYMSTPIASSAMGSNFQAIVTDIAINSGITALTGQYEGMIENAKAEAEAMGSPDDWQSIFTADLIAVAGPDVVFGAMTRSSRGLRRQDSRAKTVEAARLLKPTSDQGLDRFKDVMTRKYGKGWIANMDDVDRMAYESRRASNAALAKGELPPALDNVQKDFTPRVVIPEAGRLEIEGDKKVWRDSKGILRGINGRIEQSQGDGRYILTSENTRPRSLSHEEMVIQATVLRELSGGDNKLVMELARKIAPELSKTIVEEADRTGVAPTVENIIGELQKHHGYDVHDVNRLIEEMAGIDEVATMRRRVEAGEVKTITEEALSKMEDVDYNERVKLNKSITKDVPASVEARYAEAIQDLQDMINTDTSSKSAWRLEQQKDLLERNADVKLPAKTLKKLQQTNIQQISTSELREIAGEVERLTKQGKLSLKTKNTQAKRATSESVKKIEATAKESKVDDSAILTGEKEKRKFAGLRYTFGTGALRPWNLVDKLDGGKAKYDGEAFKKLIEEPNNSYSTYLRMSDARLRGGEGFIRGIGMTVKDLNQKHDIGSQKLTTDQLLSVYASSKNRLMHNAVLHGNFGGDMALYKQAVDVVSGNQKLKALGDYIVYDYVTNYDRVRRAYISNENKILGQEENYVPMKRIGDDDAKSMEQIALDLAGRADSTKKLPDNAFTIDRVEVPDSLQKEIKLGLYNQWEKSVNDQERYINMFGSVKQMNAIITDPALRKQMTGAYGEEYVKALDSYTEAYANPMSIYDTKSIHKYSRNMRKRTAAGFLAYNFVTMAKQVPSLALYMGQGGTKNMMLSVDDFNSSWRMVDGKLQNDLVKFVESKDPQVEHAHLERELQELKTTDRNTYDKIVGTLTDNGMKGIAALDKAVRTMGWYSVYNNSLQQGKSEAQAIQDARGATMRTQPTASAKDLPEIYKSGEMANWFLMFSNQLNQLWNLGTYQFPRSIKNDPKAAIGVASGLMINAISMYIINNHKVPETEEEVKEMMMDTSLASIPLFGSAASGALKGYDTGNPLLTSINKSVKKVLSAKERGEPMEDVLPDLFRSLTPVHGIPVGPLKRIVEGELLGKGKRDR